MTIAIMIMLLFIAVAAWIVAYKLTAISENKVRGRICTKCKWCKTIQIDEDGLYYLCQHKDSERIDVVTGDRSFKSCQGMRDEGCGGWRYEEIQSQDD